MSIQIASKIYETSLGRIDRANLCRGR